MAHSVDEYYMFYGAMDALMGLLDEFSSEARSTMTQFTLATIKEKIFAQIALRTGHEYRPIETPAVRVERRPPQFNPNRIDPTKIIHNDNLNDTI